MPLTLVLDSTTRSVSEGILGENKQPQPLADASGYKVSAIGQQPAEFSRTLLRRSENRGTPCFLVHHGLGLVSFTPHSSVSRSYISGSCVFNSPLLNGKKSFLLKYASVVSAKYSMGFVIA